jgi:hypothetical protein
MNVRARSDGARTSSGFIAAHLGSQQVSRVVYGAIIGLALILALEDHPPAAAAVAATLVATALAVAFAELYSDLLGTEARTHRRPDAAELRHASADALAVAFGIGFPAVFFVLASADAVELDLAFGLARWTGLGLIGVYGFLAGRLRGLGIGRSIVHALAVVIVGAVLIALKALLH